MCCELSAQYTPLIQRVECYLKLTRLFVMMWPLWVMHHSTIARRVMLLRGHHLTLSQAPTSAVPRISRQEFQLCLERQVTTDRSGAL